MSEARSNEDLFRLLAANFEEGPPTEAAVRTQGFPFYLRHWTMRWPEDGPGAVAQTLKADDPRGYVDRAGLLASASGVTTEADVVDFYVRICAWGTGTKARMVARRIAALRQPSMAGSLLATLETVRSGQARAAYAQFSRGGEHHIKHFGPAFFTKWLYFTAYEGWKEEDGPRPLILDARVARALGWRTNGWSADDYATYLERADQIRREWCPDRSAHVVEYALFQLGGRDKRRPQLEAN